MKKERSEIKQVYVLNGLYVTLADIRRANGMDHPGVFGILEKHVPKVASAPEQVADSLPADIGPLPPSGCWGE